MRDWTRRNVLKSGLAAAGASIVTPALARALDTAGAVAAPDETLDAGAATVPAPVASPRERLLLDFDWRFLLGHAADAGAPAGAGNGGGFAKAGDLFPPSNAKFDASAWTAVNLPHDWVVDLPFVNDKELTSWGFKPVGRAYPATSIGWYRKVFPLPAGDAGRRLALEFDGVFRDATVVLNGHLLGRNLSGYAPFRFDVSDVANFGGDNVLVVRVDATEHEGWFYEGAGIYRHVWLTKTSPVHVAPWGTFVTSAVAAGGASATVTVATEVANESDAATSYVVASSIVDAAGKTIATTRAMARRVEPWSTGETRQQLRVAAPALWSPDAPHLYTLVTTIEANGVAVDRYETPFGIRTIAFDAERGFLLNGERVEIKGTCNHQDHAGVGAALPDRLQYFRVERLKEMGSNA